MDDADLPDENLLELWQQLGFPKVEPKQDRPDDWVVVLEVAVGLGDRPYDLGVAEDLLDHLREWQPSLLYNNDSYALQMHVAAPSLADALQLAIGRHDLTTTHLGLTDLSLVRADVLTLGELERSCQGQLDGESAIEAVTDQTVVPTVAYRAMRAVLTSTTPAQLSDSLVSFVLEVGGTIHLGQPSTDPETVSVAMSIGRHSQMYASGETLTLAAFMIQQWLPPLLEDARHTLGRLSLEHPINGS